MKKILLDCESFRLKISNSVTEGGMSRNLTIRNYLVEKLGYYHTEISGNSTVSAFQVICFFLAHKSDQIFVMYPARFFLMGGRSKLNRLIGDIAVKAFLHASKNNRIIMDVSDLKYEQYIDLEIPCHDLKLIEKREQIVFGSPIEFVFASSSMKDFAIQKYGINENKCDVCINGGRVLDEEIYPETRSITKTLSEHSINCVYAGTLNKGRLIDKMLDIVSSLSTATLYLMGPMGEWVEEYLDRKNIRNVYYLGAKNERIAHQIVSMCDLGLIPYDETRLYYNIAFPTKLSFYITAGIPYLATPVKEVMMIENQKLGYTGTLGDWANIISGLSKDDIAYSKRNIKDKKRDYIWGSILSHCKLINNHYD